MTTLMIKATPLGHIPSVPGFDIVKKVTEKLSEQFKKSSGITADGKVKYGGSVSVRRHANQYYYPCYVFEPFLGSNKDNKWDTGRVLIKPKVSAGANLSLRGFWRKKVNGKKLEQWVIETAFQTPGIDAITLPQRFRAGILLAPSRLLAEGAGLYNRRVRDVHGKAGIL